MERKCEVTINNLRKTKGKKIITYVATIIKRRKTEEKVLNMQTSLWKELLVEKEKY